MVLYPNKLPESERVCSGICNLDKLVDELAKGKPMDKILRNL